MRHLSWFFGLLSLWPLFVLGQTPVPSKVAVEGYVWNEMTGEKVQALLAKGDAASGKKAFEVCVGCHRPGAVGRVNGVYPRLAGQHASVLIKQMADIRAGLRKNPKMEPFSGEHVISPQEIADIAVYLNGLPVPPDNGIGSGKDLAKGKDIYTKDCASCHGDKGEGSAEKFYPKVVGQHFKYLLREVHMIAGGDRGNANPDMLKVIKSYTDTEMEAVSDYMSRLPL